MVLCGVVWCFAVLCGAVYRCMVLCTVVWCCVLFCYVPLCGVVWRCVLLYVVLMWFDVVFCVADARYCCKEKALTAKVSGLPSLSF